MLLNMVARSKKLEEVVYTHVRMDVLETAKDVLVLPWRLLCTAPHEDGSTRYVRIWWYEN